jgi:hypothetical protein
MNKCRKMCCAKLGIPSNANWGEILEAAIEVKDGQREKDRRTFMTLSIRR